MRVNEIWLCNKSNPQDTLQAIIEENNGDSGHYERMTLASFDEYWENQDRFYTSNENTKAKVKASIEKGNKWFWFTVHC